MAAITDLSKWVIGDIHQGRHHEAYALFIVGVALVALGFADVLTIRALISAILLALSFSSSIPQPNPRFPGRRLTKSSATGRPTTRSPNCFRGAGFEVLWPYRGHGDATRGRHSPFRA